MPTVAILLGCYRESGSLCTHLNSRNLIKLNLSYCLDTLIRVLFSHFYFSRVSFYYYFILLCLALLCFILCLALLYVKLCFTQSLIERNKHNHRDYRPRLNIHARIKSSKVRVNCSENSSVKVVTTVFHSFNVFHYYLM